MTGWSRSVFYPQKNMITKKQFHEYHDLALEYYTGRAGLAITVREKTEIEIADFGLSEYEKIGLAVLVYMNTERCCAKELAMLPRQSCPEHYHPPVGADPGKEETFRCRWGKVYLYTAGPRSPVIHAVPVTGRTDYFKVWHEIELNPGDQCTIAPGLVHWFQAGPEGAVLSEFSTRSRDEFDIFTDPEIQRTTTIKE